MRTTSRVMLAAAPLSVNWTLAWFGVFTFVNAYVARGLERSAEDWTALTLGFTGGMVLWMLLATEIAARLGRRRFLILAMLGAAGVYLALPWVRNLWLLSGLLAIMAAVGASVVVVWLPMVAVAGGDRPGRNLALMQWVAQLIAPVALLTGARLVRTERWELVFVSLGSLMLACTALFAWWSGPLDMTDKTPVQSLFRLRRADSREGLGGPFLLVLLAGACIEPFNFHTINQLWPNLARDLHGSSEVMIGAIVALGRLPSLLVLLLMAAFVDRLRPAVCYGAGMVAGAGAVALAAGVGSPRGVILAYFAFYCGHAVVWGANSAAANAAAGPRLREPAFAILNVMMIGSVTLVGFLHNRLLAAGLSLPGVFRVCAAAAAVGGLVLVVRGAAKPLRRVNTPDAAGVQAATNDRNETGEEP